MTLFDMQEVPWNPDEARLNVTTDWQLEQAIHRFEQDGATDQLHAIAWYYDHTKHNVDQAQLWYQRNVDAHGPYWRVSQYNLGKVRGHAAP